MLIDIEVALIGIPSCKYRSDLRCPLALSVDGAWTVVSWYSVDITSRQFLFPSRRRTNPRLVSLSLPSSLPMPSQELSPTTQSQSQSLFSRLCSGQVPTQRTSRITNMNIHSEYHLSLLRSRCRKLLMPLPSFRLHWCRSFRSRVVWEEFEGILYPGHHTY